jgi:hypothetical protein
MFSAKGDHIQASENKMLRRLGDELDRSECKWLHVAFRVGEPGQPVYSHQAFDCVTVPSMDAA